MPVDSDDISDDYVHDNDEGSTTVHGQDNIQEEPKEVIAAKETKAVNGIRLMTFGVLVFVAIGVSLASYYYVRTAEEEEFETQFGHHAGRVVDAFTSNAKRRLAALEGFALQITSHANSKNNESFPFVTLPDYERKAAYTREIAQVMTIMTYMFVTHENRAIWEKYSVDNIGWLSEGLALQPAVAEGIDTGSLALVENSTSNFSKAGLQPFIHSPLTQGPANASDMYTPIWTMSPAIPLPRLINLNVAADKRVLLQLNNINRTKESQIHAAEDFSDPAFSGLSGVMGLFFNRWREGGNEFQPGPVSRIFVPVFAEVGDENKELAGVLNIHLYWQQHFMGLLPDNGRGIICILENTCGQAYTYVINGADAEYIGPGDLHDTQYDHLVEETGFNAFTGKESLDIQNNQLMCSYNIRIYPSEEMENEYLTNQPLSFTLVLVAVFVFTSGVFVTYDRLVSHRHQVVNQKAVESNAVVASLFPANVRSGVVDIYAGHQGEKNKPAPTSAMAFSTAANNNYYTTQSSGGDWDDSVPIANLYSDCTVLFADVAGFTKWSSSRAPTEVFKLLETLYGAFDKIARRRRVFKVETIGDCYVAVTGLPEPQGNHAVIMTKFAGDCIVKLNQMMHMLVDKLGEDTGELSMRFGLHSGPVTAGVLRGEKARFQLFGDTVNTAARIESNGQKNRIHVSQSTADLLLVAGKQSWITAREDKIVAKGKGELQTYWVTTTSFGAATAVSSRSVQSTDSPLVDAPPPLAAVEEHALPPAAQE